MPNNICLRGCNPFPFSSNIEISQNTCPFKEHFQSLQYTPLFSSALPADFEKEVTLLNEKFHWHAAQMQALFTTLYTKGSISEEDHARIQVISGELQEQYRQLQLLNLPVSTAWQEAINLIEETEALITALKEYDTLITPFDSAYEKLVNRTHDPIFPGESLSAGKDIEQALLAIIAIDGFIDQVPGANQRACLEQFLHDELAKLAWTVEDWIEQVPEDLKQELQAAKENKAAEQLTSALAGQVKELRGELQGLIELANQSALLKPLQKHFTTLLKSLESKTSQPPSVLKWGSTEWFELRAQSKEFSQSHYLSWLNPENWSQRSKQIVHALLTALQLTPDRNSPLMESLTRAAENAPAHTTTSILQESNELQRLLKEGGPVPVYLEEPYQLAVGLPIQEANTIIVQHALYRMLRENQAAGQTFAEFRQQEKDLALCTPDSSAPLTLQQTIAGMHSIRRACEALANCEQKIARLPASQIAELKHYIDLLYQGLMQSVSALPPKTCPLPRLASWMQVVQDQCFGVKTLEKKIAELMPAVRAKVDETELDEYGPKHKNLVKQARLAEILQLSGLEFILPKGIKSKAMLAFLQREAPDVFTHWQELGSRFKGYQGKDFLGESEVQHILGQIDESLRHTFETAGADPALFNRLVPAKMQTWLQGLYHKGEYLMVRSTGAEDEKEEKQKENSKERKIPNAGGNASPAYVTPAPGPFCRAAGEVIRSYFSVTSLKNRIEAGNNPFEQSLKLAVTSQQLIGEPAGGALHSSAIPISLVLFSTEPLYVGGEKFRTMRISATYGHGEGVVGNQGINSDTALLLISEKEPDKLYILYDNVEKPIRLGPVETAEGIKLLSIENPKSMQHRPVLSQELLVRLYQWGVIGEKFFDDHPTDMEIVIKGNTIYPVQARAINRPKLHTTFVDRKKIAEEKQSPITAQLQTETIVAGTASALILHSPHEILYAATLKQAEDEYKADRHRLVVVSTKEPKNSHPVVNFSSLGVPCMYTSDPKAVLQMRETAAKEPLVVCVQSGWFGKWDASIANPEAFVSEGLSVHPAQIAISLPVSLLPTETFEELPQEVAELLAALRNSWGTAALETLQQLQQHPWIHSLEDNRIHLEQAIKMSKIVPKEAKRTLRVLIELEKALNKSFAELEASLQQAQPNERLKPLFHLKVLETFLAGKTMGPGQFSLLSAATLRQEAIQAIAYQAELTHKSYLVDLLPAGGQTFDPNFAEKWRAFLLKLENLVESGVVKQSKIKEFKQVLSQLEQLKALPAALTFFIQPLEPAVECLERCLQLLSNQQSTFSDFAKLANTRAGLEGHLYRFGKKQTLEGALAEFKKLASDWSSSWLAGKYQQSNPTTRMVFLGGMFELIATMDAAIKTMKASPEFTRAEKGVYFKEMVGTFFSLYEDWTSFLSLYQSSDPEQLRAAQEYVANLKAAFEAMQATEENLEASSGFYVTSSIFTPRVADNEQPQPYVFSLFPNFTGNKQPESIEDVFTLVHQNLLKMLAFEGQKVYARETIANAALPPLVAQILLNKEIKGDQTGVLVTENDLEVAYNVPLRVHSAQLVFNYNKQTGELVLTSKFLGWDANSRWGTMLRLAQFADALGLLELAQPILKKEREIVISWKIKTPGDLQVALREFEEFCDITFHDRNSAYFKDRLPGFIGRWGLLSPELSPTIAEKMFDMPLSKEMAIEVASKYAETGQHWEFNVKALRRLNQLVKEGISDKGIEDGLRLAHLAADWGLAEFELLELALLLQDADLTNDARESTDLLFQKMSKAMLSNKETEARLLAYDTPFAARLFARLAFENSFKEQTLAFAEQHINHPDAAMRLTALQIVIRYLPASENSLHKLSLNESSLSSPVLRQQFYALMTEMLACNMPIDWVYAPLFQKIIPYSKEEYQTILQLHLQMMEKTKQGLHEALNFADRAFLEAPRENNEWLEAYYFTLLEKTSDLQPFLERIRNRSLPSKFRAILANHLPADSSIVKEVADLVLSGTMSSDREMLENSLNLIDKYLAFPEVQKYLQDLVQFGDLSVNLEDSGYILQHVRSGLAIKTQVAPLNHA